MTMAVRTILLSVLGLTLQAAASGQTNSAPLPALKIPSLNGTTLSGDKVSLPDALRGHSGVLVVGFSEKSRDEVTVWGKRLAVDFHDAPTTRYYEMPVLAGVPKLLRGWVLKKIADDVPDRAKPHFLPVYDHEAEWKSIAGFNKPDDAYVLVVDANGNVRWKIEGAATDATYADVRKHLEEIRTP